jgi:hypothetical protein
VHWGWQDHVYAALKAILADQVLGRCEHTLAAARGKSVAAAIAKRKIMILGHLNLHSTGTRPSPGPYSSTS